MKKINIVIIIGLIVVITLIIIFSFKNTETLIVSEPDITTTTALIPEEFPEQTIPNLGETTTSLSE